MSAEDEAMYFALDEAKQAEIDAMREELANHTNDKGEKASLLSPEVWTMLKIAEMGL